jgi:hypothetical protein
MGYYVQSYVTDSNAIKKLYGSKDKELLASLLDKLSDELQNLNDDFSSQINENKNAQTIVADFINGEVRFPELAFMYGYVYEKLCEHFGERVIPPNEEFSTNYYWAVPKQTYKAFIPIPFSKDFPEIYSISLSDLVTEKATFLGLTKREGADEDYLIMEKEDFEFTFDKALDENKDLVFFLY